MAKKIKWFELGFYSLGSVAIGGLGGIFTASSVKTWYLYLDKPFFTPPSWLFGPVWTLLFALMGLAFYFVNLYGAKSKELGKARTLFYTQFGLNLLWSFLFFYMKMPWLAFLEILIMWLYIFLTIKSFNKILKTAAWMLYPYLAWVTFASLLNLGVALLN
jgi:tryptophan-rich sensory protein